MEVQQRINMNFAFKSSRMSQKRQMVAVKGLYSRRSVKNRAGLEWKNLTDPAFRRHPVRKNNTAVQMHSTVHWKYLWMALIFIATHFVSSQKSCHLPIEITTIHKMTRQTLFILLHVSEFLCLTLWKNKQGIHLLYCYDWCS